MAKATQSPIKKIATSLRLKTVSRIMLARRRRRRNAPVSGLELKVQGWLEAAGISFLTQFAVGRCHTDLFFEPRLIVEICGCYWHKHLKCYPEPSKADKRKLAKDKARYKYFVQRGFDLLLLWECDIERLGESVIISQILDRLGKEAQRSSIKNRASLDATQNIYY